jgi:hypothetical protein
VSAGRRHIRHGEAAGLFQESLQPYRRAPARLYGIGRRSRLWIAPAVLREACRDQIAHWVTLIFAKLPQMVAPFRQVMYTFVERVSHPGGGFIFINST